MRGSYNTYRFKLWTPNDLAKWKNISPLPRFPWNFRGSISLPPKRLPFGVRFIHSMKPNSRWKVYWSYPKNFPAKPRKKPGLYWLFNRDPYNVSSNNPLYKWAVCHPLPSTTQVNLFQFGVPHRPASDSRCCCQGPMGSFEGRRVDI